jgi:hypothetical protein
LQAEGLVLSLKELFQTVFEIRKKKLAETNNNTEPETAATGEKNVTAALYKNISFFKNQLRVVIACLVTYTFVVPLRQCYDQRRTWCFRSINLVLTLKS